MLVGNRAPVVAFWSWDVPVPFEDIAVDDQLDGVMHVDLAGSGDVDGATLPLELVKQLACLPHIGGKLCGSDSARGLSGFVVPVTLVRIWVLSSGLDSRRRVRSST